MTNFQLKNDFRETKTNKFFVPFRFCSDKKIEKFLARNMFRVIFYFTNSFKSHIFISGIFFEFWNQNFFLKFLSSAKTTEKRKKRLKLFSWKGFWGEHFSMLASKVQCTIMTIYSSFSNQLAEEIATKTVASGGIWTENLKFRKLPLCQLLLSHYLKRR